MRVCACVCARVIPPFKITYNFYNFYKIILKNIDIMGVFEVVKKVVSWL